MDNAFCFIRADANSRFAPMYGMDAKLDLLGLVTLCQFSRNVWVSLRDVRGTDGSPVSDNVWSEPAFSFKGRSARPSPKL